MAWNWICLRQGKASKDNKSCQKQSKAIKSCQKPSRAIKTSKLVKSLLFQTWQAGARISKSVISLLSRHGVNNDDLGLKLWKPSTGGNTTAMECDEKSEGFRHHCKNVRLFLWVWSCYDYLCCCWCLYNYVWGA